MQPTAHTPHSSQKPKRLDQVRHALHCERMARSTEIVSFSRRKAYLGWQWVPAARNISAGPMIGNRHRQSPQAGRCKLQEMTCTGQTNLSKVHNGETAMYALERRSGYTKMHGAVRGGRATAKEEKNRAVLRAMIANTSPGDIN